jgi:hypothetical protein
MNDFLKIISDDLKRLFSFPYHDFSDPIQWSDAIGISRVKKYPNGYASLYKVGIVDSEVGKDTNRKKLWVTVSYGKDTPSGITLGSSERVSEPVDVEFLDEFSYDFQTKTFYFLNKEISPLGLISYIEKEHIKPTRIIRGFTLRLRLRVWRRALPFLIELFDGLLRAILWVVSGEGTAGDMWDRMMANRYKTKYDDPIRTRQPEVLEHREFTKVGIINFFGYEAKRWSVVFYCVIHLLIFSLLFLQKYRSVLVETLFGNNFLTLCYIVVSFAITEAGLPKILKKLIDSLIPDLFRRVVFKKLKV